jgi:hypothetical protein
MPWAASTQEKKAPVWTKRARRRSGRHKQSTLLRTVAIVLTVAVPLMNTGCGSSHASATVSSEGAKAQVNVTCARVADVLADGPDPAVDPIGYALAQVAPLRDITASDRALQRDIANLASAYEAAYRTSNSKGSAAAVDKAGKELDSICPGAF